MNTPEQHIRIRSSSVGFKEDESIGAADLHNQNGFESNSITYGERKRSKKSCSYEVSGKSQRNGKTLQRVLSLAHPKR
jgi:hypothetical protein